MTTEEHHYEVLVTVTDGTLIDFDINDEPSATWWDGMVYMPDEEGWHVHGQWDNLAMSAMCKFADKIKRSYSFPTDGSFCMLWQGHILEAYGTEQECRERVKKYTEEIKAGKHRDFLDPEDLDEDNQLHMSFVRDIR